MERSMLIFRTALGTAAYVGPVRYTSKGMKIDRHYWRAVVYFDPQQDRHFIEYEWRRQDSHLWHGSKMWRQYDDNDFNCGLPAEVENLYLRELPELARYLPSLQDKPAAQRAQLALAI